MARKPKKEVTQNIAGGVNATVQVEVVRDMWTEDGRCRAGEVLEMSTEEALDAIEKGLVKRAK